jgi:DNA-binding NarL/FixJ family response regulator
LNKPEKILVVDDEWLVAVDVQRTLRRAGYVVDEIVTSAPKVLAALHRVGPDLVLLDIDLGTELDGLELANRIRAQSPVPIVFLSAHCDPPTLKRAMRASPHGFVVKPFTEAQLLTAVQLALHQPDTKQAHAATAQQTLQRIASLLSESGHVFGGLAKSRQAEIASALSAREREILDALLNHQRVPGIARTLGISEHTVRNHLKSIYAKLGVHSQEELLEFVVRSDARDR